MIVEPAPAKINLALHVRRRRHDGYHELETLFAFAQDGDVVRVAEAPADTFAIDGPFAASLRASDPSPEAQPGNGPPGNLVLRARDAFRTVVSTPPVAITLTKNLPVASGIGGGSADAAATLRALARIAGVDPADPRLQSTAASLGADVPACLLSRTALGMGKGEELVALDGLAGTPLLLVNPNVAVSTSAVFSAWDGVDRGPLPPGDLLERALRGRNDLEPAAVTLAPVIVDVRGMLDSAPGAILTRMSGSGATCFALFETAAARDAAAAIAGARSWWTLATEMN